MRVVLDTNILARATPGAGGPARELVLRCLDPPHILALSPFMLSELARVLRYPRLMRLHGLSEEEMDQYVDAMRTGSLIVLVPEISVDTVVTYDPDDDPVIATAVMGQAGVLCTKDRHFHDPRVQSYCDERGIRIMDDVELLELLRELEAGERGQQT